MATILRSHSVVVGDFNNEFVDAGVLSTAGIKVAGASHTAVSCSIDKYHKDEPTYADPDRAYVTAFYADAAAAESTLVDQMLEHKGWRAGDSCLAGPAPQLRVASGAVPFPAHWRETNVTVGGLSSGAFTLEVRNQWDDVASVDFTC